jgi:hypothetical protein
MLKWFYDWFIVGPADMVAAAFFVFVWPALFYLVICTWLFVVHGSIHVLERDTYKASQMRYVLGFVVCAYVFVVTGTAVLRLPHVIADASSLVGR